MNAVPKSPEFALLRSVCAGEDAIRTRAAAAAITDWEAVSKLAGRHGVSALLAGAVVAMDGDTFPEAFREKMSVVRRATALRLEVRETLLRRIREGLGTGHEEIRELKGGDVASWAYDEPGQRQVGDLDILIHSDDIEAIDAVLRSLGFRRTFPTIGLDRRTLPLIRASRSTMEYAAPRGFMGVDVHWRWTSNPHLLPFDADRLRAGSWSDQRAEMFLYLLVHGGRHAWCRLSWLTDIHRIVTAATNPPLDWPRVLDRAHQLGAMPWLGLGFEMCHRILGTPIQISDRPPAPAALVQQCLRELASSNPEALRPAHWSGLRRELLGCGGWAQRGRVFRHAVFAPSDRDIETVALPEAWSAVYGLLRPFLWLGRRIGG